MWSLVLTYLFYENIMLLLGLESFKMEKKRKVFADPNWMSRYA